jgi:hypothetical protein
VLLAVAEADAKARKQLFKQEEWQKVLDRVQELTDKFQGQMKIDNLKKVVNGELVMKLKGISPGPTVGNIIKKTLEWMIDNSINPNEKDKIEQFILNQ